MQTITLTLKRVFAAEQVQPKECHDLRTYSQELKYSIRMLQAHARRVKIWRQGLTEAEQVQGFNTKFVELMRELEALEGERC